MAIDPEEVERVAALARLRIPKERLPRLAGELSKVLDYVAALRRLDLAGAEPGVLAPADGPLREDAIDRQRLLASDVALASAPEAEPPFFLVPPIVEHLEP